MSEPGRDSARVVLVRHGETDYNRQDRWQGSASDVPLNERGRAQARAVAAALAEAFDGRVSAAYTSDLRRARETATILAARLDVPVREEPALRELSHGRWEGRTHAEVRELWPRDYAVYEADPYGTRRGGGDSYADLEERLWPALERMARSHPGQRVLAVSHGGPIRLALSRILELPLTEREALGVTNGAWFEIARVADEWSLTRSGTAEA